MLVRAFSLNDDETKETTVWFDVEELALIESRGNSTVRFKYRFSGAEVDFDYKSIDELTIFSDSGRKYNAYSGNLTEFDETEIRGN